MAVAQELKALLMQVLGDRTDRRSLERLVHLLVEIARCQIFLFHRSSFPTFDRSGYTPQNVAGLAVTELLSPADGTPLDELRIFLSGFLPRWGMLPEEEILIAIRRLVGIKINRAIASIHGEVDPEYRKIHRNLHDFFRDHPAYSMLEVVDGDVWFRKSNRISAMTGLRPEAESILADLFAVRPRPTTVDELVSAVFDIIDSMSECRRACSLLELSMIIRDFHAQFVFETISDESTEMPSFLDSEVLECIERSVLAVSSKYLSKCMERGALSRDECLAYTAAGRSFCEDIVEKAPRNLFDYYSAQFPDRDREDYRKDGRIRFENFMKKVKDEFLRRLHGLLE